MRVLSIISSRFSLTRLRDAVRYVVFNLKELWQNAHSEFDGSYTQNNRGWQF